jgi:hypothetical protein
MSTATIGRHGRGRHAIGYVAPGPEQAPSRLQRVFARFGGALRRGGHPAVVTEAAEPEMEATLAALPAPVLSPQPSGVNWEPGTFTGAADTGLAEGWPKFGGGKGTGPLQRQPWPLATEEPPECPEQDPACTATAETLADPGCATVTGAPRPFACENTAAPFPVAFRREYGPDWHPLTEREDEQMSGTASFTGLFPFGADLVAEVSLGYGPDRSFAIAGNSLYLRTVAAELTHAAHCYDQAVAVTDEVVTADGEAAGEERTENEEAAEAVATGADETVSEVPAGEAAPPVVAESLPEAADEPVPDAPAGDQAAGADVEDAA